MALEKSCCWNAPRASFTDNNRNKYLWGNFLKRQQLAIVVWAQMKLNWAKKYLTLFAWRRTLHNVTMTYTRRADHKTHKMLISQHIFVRFLIASLFLTSFCKKINESAKRSCYQLEFRMNTELFYPSELSLVTCFLNSIHSLQRLKITEP
jgi:hypothetical protein